MALATICKILLIILNLVFMILSLAFIAVGVILTFVVDILLESAFDSAKDAAATTGYTITGDATQLKDFPLLYEIGVALLAFGVILFFLSMLGCCGGCCTSCCRMMLLVFAVILSVVIIAQIVVFSLFLVKDSPLHDKIKDEVKSKITSDYDENNGDAFTAAIIIINREGNCCGMDGVADFGAKQHLSCDAADEQKGCYTEMQDNIEDNKIYAGLVVAALLAMQLLEVICAIVIFKDAKSKISPF